MNAIDIGWTLLALLTAIVVNASNSSQTTALISGASSGFVSGMLLQPFAVVKTRLQETKSNVGVKTILRSVYREKGIFGFWRGTGLSLCEKVPGNAIFFFAANGYVKLVLLAANSSPNYVSSLLVKENSPSVLTPFGNWFAGCATGITNGFVSMPLNLVKSSLFKYKSISKAFREIRENEGTVGLFRGYPPTAIRDATYCGIYFLAYRHIQGLLVEKNNHHLFHHNVVAGLVAGMIATVMSHPYDLIRSRMQVRPNEFRTILKTIIRIWGREGARTFFNGLTPRLFQASLRSAINWAIYEEFAALASRDAQKI